VSQSYVQDVDTAAIADLILEEEEAGFLKKMEAL